MPKKGKDEFRDIADARMDNKTILPWGTRLFMARDLASSLRWRAIMDGFDISEGCVSHFAAQGLHGRAGLGLWHYRRPTRL